MGVRQVRSPSGEVWWVKRAWVPRYRGMRDRVGDYLEGRPHRWYQAPLRLYARGYDRWSYDGPDPSAFLPSDVGPVPGTSASVDPSLSADGSSGFTEWSGDASTGPALDLDLGGGGVGDFSPSEPGLPDVGGGGDLLGSGSVGGGSFADVGGSAADAGGGGDVDLDPGDLGVVVLLVIAALALVAVSWFVLLPLLLVVVDGAVLLIAVLAAGAVRVLMGRPWDVVAVRDLPGGRQIVRRWELRGHRRAGRARDDVARALETGTDADLAVARVVAREPHPDDPAGIARSVRERHQR